MPPARESRTRPSNLGAVAQSEASRMSTDVGRTSCILRILSFNSVIHCIGFVTSYYMVSTVAACVHILSEPPEPPSSTSWGLWPIWQTVLQCLLVFVLAAGSVSVGATLFPMRTTVSEQRPSLKRNWKVLYLCLVTKGLNRQTVLRSVSEMKPLLAGDTRLRFVILTEQGRDFNASDLGVDVVFIPNAYQARVAQYKARALEFFRLHCKLTHDAWVLHLDEETCVDAHCLNACVRFIENTRFEWGQGLIMYNIVNYWESALLTFAEALRFREDLGRFQVQHARLHYTLWGCHGSFLLTSGQVENVVTWETSCLAEDFWFADRACAAGFGGGWIPSIAREQCNLSVRDFLKQRRRWYCGMWQVGIWGKLMDLTWVLSTLELPLVLLTWSGCLHLPQWLATWMHVYFSSNAFSALLAMLLQDLDANVPIRDMCAHVLLIPALSLAVQGMQGAAILYSFLCAPVGFHVVDKK